MEGVNNSSNSVMTTEMHLGGDVRYSIEYQAIAFSVFTTLFVVGFFGNLLVIFVVIQSQKMRTLTNFYLVSLASADILVLIGGTLTAIPELFYYKEQWLYGSVMCSVFVFMQYLGINASALSITAFTVERYVGICHPMKAQIIYTPQRAKYIIAVLWIVSILYNSCWMYLAKTVEQDLGGGIMVESCTFRISREQYQTIYMVDLILFYIIPLILTCALYTLIGLALHQSTKAMRPPKSPKKELSKGNSTVECLMKEKPRIRRKNQQSMLGDRSILKRMEKARFQVVKMLIVVAVLFAILWLPYRAWVVYNSFASKEKRFYNEWFYLLARTMVFVNNAINPILYSAMSKKFRQAFIQHTCLGRCVNSANLNRNTTRGPYTTTTTALTINNTANGSRSSLSVEYNATKEENISPSSPVPADV